MICPNSNCKKFVSPFEDTCQHCGALLKNGSINDYAKKADEIMSKDEVMLDIVGAGLQNFVRDKHHHELSSSFAIQDFVKTDLTQLMQGAQFEFAEPHSDKKLDFEEAKEIMKAYLNVVRFYKIRVLIKDALFRNPRLTENSDYCRRFKITDFSDVGENYKVDAFASYDQQTSRYTVKPCAGYINMIIALEWFFKMREFNKGGEEKFILERIIYFISENEEFNTDSLILTLLKCSTNYLSNKHDFFDHSFMMMEKAFITISMAVAHELGHICLGHGEDNKMFLHQNYSINQEIEADSFAYSILAPNYPESLKEDLLLASIKSEFAGVLLDIIFLKLWKRQPVHTHSRERLINAIRANHKIAQDHSIDEAWVVYILSFEWLRK